jgi:hypothetical protein
MGKLTGSTNYKLSEILRLLALVEQYLPLGKDEWERLVIAYNASRGRGIAERDFESLRRKFKMIYSIQKPTGVADMPQQVHDAKQLKQAIDEKASVVEMDDGADVDDQEEQEVQPDFSFDFPGDENLDNELRENPNDSSRASEETDTSTTVPESSGGLLSGLLDPTGAQEGLEAFASTPRPSPQSISSSQWRLHSAGLAKPHKVPGAATPELTIPTSPTQTVARQAKPSARSTRDQAEALRNPKLSNSSNRLGGGNLAEFRDSIGRKRALEEDEDLREASYAKVKRVRATKATTVMKKCMSDLESALSSMGSSVFKMMVMMREESERKAEARRVDEEQRRRDEMAAREAGYLANKEEAAERRHQEKLEMEERARRDKVETCARTQELMLLNRDAGQENPSFACSGAAVALA